MSKETKFYEKVGHLRDSVKGLEAEALRLTLDHEEIDGFLGAIEDHIYDIRVILEEDTG